MKKILLLTVLALSVPYTVLAKNSDDGEVIAEKTKYYKTIENRNISSFSLINNNSYSVEITEEEYNNFDSSNNILGPIVETTYKKMTTSIIKYNSYYRYNVELLWKNVPKVRSYDTIAIGHMSNVIAKSSPVFKMNYCLTSGSCYNTNTYSYLYKSNNGIGITFSVPTGEVASMKQNIYIDVEKNTSSTIIKQVASGDYAHAIKTISISDAKKYTVDINGIILNSAISSSYDSIDTAQVVWNGTW